MPETRETIEQNLQKLKTLWLAHQHFTPAGAVRWNEDSQVIEEQVTQIQQLHEEMTSQLRLSQPPSPVIAPEAASKSVIGPDRHKAAAIYGYVLGQNPQLFLGEGRYAQPNWQKTLAAWFAGDVYLSFLECDLEKIKQNQKVFYTLIHVLANQKTSLLSLSLLAYFIEKLYPLESPVVEERSHAQS